MSTPFRLFKLYLMTSFALLLEKTLVHYISPFPLQPQRRYIAMDFMWHDVQTYFGDGYIALSSPIRFNVHCCRLNPLSARNNNIFFGVEINEQMMPLFSALGDTCRPACSCGRIEKLCTHISDYIKTAPSSYIDDYSLHTAKGDTSVDEASMYAMRDSLQWWAHWHGSLENHHWKHLYIAFSTIPDDVMIPPQHLVNDSFRLLGNSLSDVLAGLRSENVHPDDITFLKMCLWRQYILQYLEKADPELRTVLLSNTTAMTQFRTITANTHGAAVALLAARGAKSLGTEDAAVEMAAICDALSMDMAKEALGVLRGENTETVAGNRELLKSELRWMYVRCIEFLDLQPSAPLLRRFATSGLHFVPIMDRYRERLKGIRIPFSHSLRRKLDSYIAKNESQARSYGV